MDALEMKRPWMMSGAALRLLVAPSEKRIAGTHSSERKGTGFEIERVRPLEPDDERRFYSPPHSAQFKIPYGIFFRHEQELRLLVIVDYPRAMDFGQPSKRAVALKIASTLARIAVQEPNNGVVRIAGAGDGTYASLWLSDDVGAKTAIARLECLAPRKTRSDGLSRSLRAVAENERGCLIFVISDFLIPLAGSGSDEWTALSQIVRMAADAGNEAILLRISDSVECDFPPFGSVAVSSRAWPIWTTPGTAKRIRNIHQEIRNRLVVLSGDDHRDADARLRFLEIVWRDSGETAYRDLKAFLFSRMRKIRKRVGAAS